MKKILLSIASLLIISYSSLYSQCTITSTDCGGYNIDILITPVNIIPATDSCAAGYNYNVEFDYIITVSGINTCYDGTISIQPEIVCNSQINGYYSITIPAPIVGHPYESVTYTGTLTTTSNPFNSASDCATVTPSSLDCKDFQVTAEGPGIPVQTYPYYIAPLPIELLSFTGTCEQDNIVLDWSTASETNNDFFTVECSSDNVRWKKIKTIPGAGNSSTIRNYSISAIQENKGVSYYRLKQTDFDGEYKYSRIISVKNCISTETENSLGIYPNPSTEKFNLQYNGDKEKVSSLDIYNVTGKRIYHSDSYQSSIDLSNQQNGIYLLRLNSGGEVITQKLSLSVLQFNDL